jgi:hypothetical protein
MRPRDLSVIFQTRLWRPEDNSAAPDVDKVNEERANMVRSLRSAFRERFVGGIVADAYSRTFCPDAVVSAHTSRRAYIRRTQHALVGVFTRGLHDSLGFRLPEYLAAGVCIVSKAIQDVIPAPLAVDVHYKSYQSINECISQCDYLLTHPDEAQRMRIANTKYYVEWCSPKQQMLLLLKRCFSDVQ